MKGTIMITVSPEVLVKQAEEVRQLGIDMKKRFYSLQTMVERTKGYWIGDAAELHRKIFDEHKDDIEHMLRRLMEHPDDLLAISENYNMAEKNNLGFVAELDADVIV